MRPTGHSWLAAGRHVPRMTMARERLSAPSQVAWQSTGTGRRSPRQSLKERSICWRSSDSISSVLGLVSMKQHPGPHSSRGTDLVRRRWPETATARRRFEHAVHQIDGCPGRLPRKRPLACARGGFACPGRGNPPPVCAATASPDCPALREDGQTRREMALWQRTIFARCGGSAAQWAPPHQHDDSQHILQLVSIVRWHLDGVISGEFIMSIDTPLRTMSRPGSHGAVSAASYAVANHSHYTRVRGIAHIAGSGGDVGLYLVIAHASCAGVYLPRKQRLLNTDG